MVRQIQMAVKWKVSKKNPHKNTKNTLKKKKKRQRAEIAMRNRRDRT